MQPVRVAPVQKFIIIICQDMWARACGYCVHAHYVCVCVCVCVYMCMCVCVCIHKCIDIDLQIYRYIERNI